MMKSLSKIKANNESFFLMTTVKEDDAEGLCELDVILTDAINAWSGCNDSVSDTDLTDLSRKIGEDEDKFRVETKKALTGVDLGGLIFEYQVTPGKDGCRELAWKRVMSDDDIKFQLGSVRLVPEEDPSVHVRAILQHSMEEMAASQLKIQRLQREQERLSREREQALKRLEKCVEMKEELDRDLYSKFCVILNEKKAKIRQLRQNGPMQVPANDPDVAEEEGGDGSPPRDQQDMGDVSTDEEREVTKDKKHAKRNVPADREDDSLILEEEEDSKPTTSYGKSGRRKDRVVSYLDGRSPMMSSESPEGKVYNRIARRKRKPEVRQTASSSKPSIPRVPSTPKTASQSIPTRSGRTPSLRSTPSSSRKKQMPELDASDLFEEM